MDLTRATFSGHESFPFRSTWLTKGVTECSRDPSIFTKDEAMVVLGVGKNMVRSIRHWCLATRVLEEDAAVRNNRGRLLRPSAIGGRIFLNERWDPYLEDTATLWLIHWLLATNPDKATTCYYAFSLLREPEFTRRSLESSISTMAQRFPALRVSEHTLRRDVDILIRTYVPSAMATGASPEESLDCPLAELGLIFEVEHRRMYAFSRGPKETLPDAALVFALWDYGQRAGGIRSLSFDELAYGPLSPGAVFKLDEVALAERLDRLSELTSGAWQFSETAGLKQVLILREIDPMEVLRQYYGGLRGRGVGAAA